MPRGRPRKYQTEEEAAEAARQLRQQRYQRQRRAQAPPEFIAYAPTIPGAPTTTYLDIGLRISADVPIPRDAFTLPDEPLEGEDEYRQPSPLASLAVAEVEAAAVISQLRASDREQTNESIEYEQRILQQIQDSDARAARILLEIQARTAQNTSANGILEHSGNVERPAGLENDSTHSHAIKNINLQRSSITPVTKELAYSVSYASTPSLAKAANALAEASDSPQTPSQRSVSSAQLSGRRKTFPVQSNTLLSWVKRVPRQSSKGSQAPQPAQLIPSHSTPLPLPPSSTSSTPRLPQLSNSNSIPQLAAQEAPAAASPSPFIRPSNMPSPAAARAASQARSTSRASSPPILPTERTAYKLAKQLRNFQGCTHEEHTEADRRHEEHHQRPDVYSTCSSFKEITRLLRGVHNGGTPLPNVLSNPKLMEPSALPKEVDLKAAFEGTSPRAFPKDVGTLDEKLPHNLCLQQHYNSSRKGRAAKVRFDVDSVCCFPSSLAFARNGIDWHPQAHPILNLDADIHFSLIVSAYNSRGDLVTRTLPLHKIPHYCFGSVAGSTKSLRLFIFFPELHLESQYEHTTYLSKQDQQLWLDAVLLPAIGKTVNDSTLVSYLPVSEDNASKGVTAASAEKSKRKESAREQLLEYRLQHQYLDPLWTAILDRIAENPGLDRFNNATLFVHAKNTKLAHMTNDLTAARDRTFVDIAKTITSEDYAYPYEAVPDGFEAETYLWKRCCLESYARTRVKLLENGNRARGSPRVTTYPWATMRDSMGQTLTSMPRGQENMDGLVYSQFYGNIKTPFDDSKVYVFDNQALENLALDPGYARSLQQQGGNVAFSENVCKGAYLHSKGRAFSNLRDNQRKSYGIREEHRVSLTMMDDICEQWREWDLYDDSIDDADQPLPYYIVPSPELFSFLYAQINKYCFLFEHTLAHTARTYSLPETMVMVIALRALRFCYGSSLLARESLLYKDRWEQTRGRDVVVKEGLGMRETMERCGLGWFLPKFSWATRRLAQPHGDNMLVGNLLMHAEYKRRWRAVKDLRDVFVRFNQATGWYQQYDVQQHPWLLKKWLEYLHVLCLEQFDADVWTTMLAAHKRRPELSAAALKQDGNVAFCYKGMKRMFTDEGVVAPPHIVTGNKMRFSKLDQLLDFLFLWDDNQERQGWGARPYRLILQKSFEFIESQLGYRRASRWLDEFFYLVQLTHWMLPYPSNKSLIMSTKESHSKGLRGRMMWFSAVFTDPSLVRLPFDEPPRTVYDLVYQAHRQSGRAGGHDQAWETTALMKACRRQGLGIQGVDKTAEHWIAGRTSAGTKGFVPVWERGMPPRLAMRERIKGLSLDELDGVMVAFTQEGSAVVVEGVQEEDCPVLVGRATDSRHIPDFFGEGRERRGEGKEASS
ncbi:hypothetical protein A1F99_140680 [Pyrenophora tritici-repentis]|nr:hypothetical protein A1F99_140680 [Pyrenophora tritici-repentis]